MNADNTDFPVIVSLHPESGLDDLPNSGVAWGTLVSPGLALLAEPASDLSGPLRLLAGAPGPNYGPLLDAPVARVLHLGRNHRAVLADLGDWNLAGEELWAPGDQEPFDDEAAALADLILSRCPQPDENWFDRAGKARAGRTAPPYPYPFRSLPILESRKARKHDKERTWIGVLGPVRHMFGW
jgi:hypothetical protein